MKKKDWLKWFSDLFKSMMWAFLGVMFLMAFVASMHYMAIVAQKYEYVKQMFFWWGMFALSWCGYMIMRAIEHYKNKKKRGDA